MKKKKNTIWPYFCLCWKWKSNNNNSSSRKQFQDGSVQRLTLPILYDMYLANYLYRIEWGDCDALHMGSSCHTQPQPSFSESTIRSYIQSFLFIYLFSCDEKKRKKKKRVTGTRELVYFFFLWEAFHSFTNDDKTEYTFGYLTH